MDFEGTFVAKSFAAFFAFDSFLVGLQNPYLFELLESHCVRRWMFHRSSREVVFNFLTLTRLLVSNFEGIKKIPEFLWEIRWRIYLGEMTYSETPWNFFWRSFCGGRCRRTSLLFLCLKTVSFSNGKEQMRANRRQDTKTTTEDANAGLRTFSWHDDSQCSQSASQWVSEWVNITPPSLKTADSSTSILAWQQSIPPGSSLAVPSPCHRWMTYL